MTEKFNPFVHLDAIRLEAVGRVQTSYSQAAFTDSVLPGRTIPSADDLPASLIYFADEPEIVTGLDPVDSKLKPVLQVVAYVDASVTHPEQILDARGKEIWNTLEQYAFTSISNAKAQGLGFSYQTDAESSLTSLTVSFQLEFNSTVTLEGQ